MSYDPIIVRDPQVLGGKPVIRGTRISVEFVLELVASGMGIDDILRAYPFLDEERVRAALQFATQEFKHEEVDLESVPA